MKYRIRRCEGVAVWKWKIDADCSICRNAFEACCPDCKFPGDDCPPMWGACHHPFHMHCIIKWLKAQTEKHQKEECPLCRAPWAFEGEEEEPQQEVQEVVEEEEEEQLEDQEYEEGEEEEEEQGQEMEEEDDPQ